MNRMADCFFHGFSGIDPVKLLTEGFSGGECMCFFINPRLCRLIYDLFLIVNKPSEMAAQSIQVKALQYFNVVINEIMTAGSLKHRSGSCESDFINPHIFYRQVQRFQKGLYLFLKF